MSFRSNSEQNDQVTQFYVNKRKDVYNLIMMLLSLFVPLMLFFYATASIEIM